jgi:MFS family permease
MGESVWSPLKNNIYRSFWICAFLSNLGTWIQDVAAGWMMTHLNTSPLVIALLSFATNLPIVLLSIPSGYIADLGHRRSVLLTAQILMFCSASLLAYLVWQNQLTELSLLTLSFCMGVGYALTNPAFQSVLTDLVPTHQQSQAVLVYYMGINITRVLGPTVGGGLLSGFGAQSAFLFNALSFLGLIMFFVRWPVPEKIENKEAAKIIPEDWRPLFSLHNLKLWLEIFFVTFFASSLWALYPMRGRVELSLSSLQYGSLLGFFGLGACVSAFMSERIMAPERTHQSLAGSYMVYAVGIFLLSMAPHYWLMCAAMFFGGTGWIVLATLMNMSSRQVTGKSHLKATMLGVFMCVFYAGMTMGSVSWGTLARFSTSSSALFVAAIGLGIIGVGKGLRTLKF